MSVPVGFVAKKHALLQKAILNFEWLRNIYEQNNFCLIIKLILLKTNFNLRKFSKKYEAYYAPLGWREPSAKKPCE